MDLYDWLLFLHVLSAFLAVACADRALGARAELERRSRRMMSPDSAMRFGRTAGIVVGVGMMGAIIFGIWLAIDVDGYELWDLLDPGLDRDLGDFRLGGRTGR